jgi:hypothetical protein
MSLIAHFTTLSFADFLSLHDSQLVRLAEEFNIAVVVINQCMADPGAMSMFGPVIKPVSKSVQEGGAPRSCLIDCSLYLVLYYICHANANPIYDRIGYIYSKSLSASLQLLD